MGRVGVQSYYMYIVSLLGKLLYTHADFHKKLSLHSLLWPQNYFFKIRTPPPTRIARSIVWLSHRLATKLLPRGF